MAYHSLVFRVASAAVLLNAQCCLSRRLLVDVDVEAPRTVSAQCGFVTESGSQELDGDFEIWTSRGTKCTHHLSQGDLYYSYKTVDVSCGNTDASPETDLITVVRIQLPGEQYSTDHLELDWLGVSFATSSPPTVSKVTLVGNHDLDRPGISGIHSVKCRYMKRAAADEQADILNENKVTPEQSSEGEGRGNIPSDDAALPGPPTEPTEGGVVAPESIVTVADLTVIEDKLPKVVRINGGEYDGQLGVVHGSIPIDGWLQVTLGTDGTGDPVALQPDALVDDEGATENLRGAILASFRDIAYKCSSGEKTDQCCFYEKGSCSSRFNYLGRNAIAACVKVCTGAAKKWKQLHWKK